jgi:HPt (histidine-containing phosphotransfer) domain-containing protein
LRRLEGFDLAAGLHRLRGREASYIRLVGLFADGHRGDAERLQSVIAAGDLEEAGRLAHSLKGAAGMAGATAVQQAAACIEQALRETGRVDNALLEELAHGLDVLMACIDAGGFEGHAEGQGQEGAGRELATSSPEALARVLDEIEALLVDDDSAVNAVCVRHQALLQAACGAAGERLLRDVEHYDYESARTVLADMRAHMAR